MNMTSRRITSAIPFVNMVSGTFLSYLFLLLIFNINVCVCFNNNNDLSNNSNNTIKSNLNSNSYTSVNKSTNIDSHIPKPSSTPDLATSTVSATTTSSTLSDASVGAAAPVEPTIASSANGTVNRQKPFLSTGNTLWDGLIQDCLHKPSFSCIQKNVYTYLDDTLNVEDVNVTNRFFFTKNKVDFTKYTKEANYDLDNNEIPDADARSESPIEEVTKSLYGKSIKFMMTHDVDVKLPEIMFDGSVFRIQPRSIEGNGIIAKLELIPRTEIESRGTTETGRIFFKKIKKFFKNKLLLGFLAIIVVIKIIKIKVMWLLPLLVGVGAAKKLVLKFLLFLFPALSHIFKLCSYYHHTYHKSNYHHHQHHIQHLHTTNPQILPYDHEHYPNAHHQLPELIYTKPPKGHPSEYLHGNSVPPHQAYGPPDWELSGPGLGSEYISDIHRNGAFKPKVDDVEEINAWGLGNKHQNNQNNRIQNSKVAVSGPGYQAQHPRGPSIQASQIASQYVAPPIEDQVIREAQKQEAMRIQAEQRLIAKQQQILQHQPFVSDGNPITPKQIDPFYSPILARLDKVFTQLNFMDETCRERLICSMYKNPSRYTPHSNFISSELSRDASELQKPTSSNVAVVRFYRYVQAAREGQDQKDCLRMYQNCGINTE